VAIRRLTEREKEILLFLLSAVDLPDRDALLQQAEVAEVADECSCGCASIDLEIDRSVATQARQDLSFDLVSAHADDLQLVNRRHRLTVMGDDLTFDESLPVPDDLEGAIGLILFVEDGWISGLEIWSAGDFRNPEVFPPPDVFGSPELRTPS